MVRLGVVGTGEYGSLHIRTCKQLEQANLAMLIAAAARSEQSARRVETDYAIHGYTDYRQMLDREELDAWR